MNALTKENGKSKNSKEAAKRRKQAAKDAKKKMKADKERKI